MNHTIDSNDPLIKLDCFGIRLLSIINECLFGILESEETSGQNEEAQGKTSTGTEGAETKGGACGTTADEIPGTLMKLWENV